MEEWWTYELCYRKQLRQYHKEGGKVVSQYILGRYSGAGTEGSGEEAGSGGAGGKLVPPAAEAAPPAAEGSVAGKDTQPSSSAAAEAFAAADAKAAAAKAADAAAVAAAEDEVQVRTGLATAGRQGGWPAAVCSREAGRQQQCLSAPNTPPICPLCPTSPHC